MFKRKCKVTFIAHGSTVYSEENRITDRQDYPQINDTGYIEINKILEFIKNRGLKTDKIYTSPALCCVQSAEIISQELKMDFDVLPELYNRKCGIWSGLTFEEIEQKYPDLMEKYHKNPLTVYPENGEILESFNNRVKDILDNIINENIGGRIIVVTHPSIIQSAIKSTLNIAEGNQYKVYIRTASATQISYFENWSSLVYSNYKSLI